MLAVTDFRDKFEERVRSRPLRSTLEMTDHGALFGTDTVMWAADRHGEWRLSDREEERFFAWLGVAYKRRVASDVIAPRRHAHYLLQREVVLNTKVVRLITPISPPAGASSRIHQL